MPRTRYLKAVDGTAADHIAATLAAALVPRLEPAFAGDGPDDHRLRQTQAVIAACDLYREVRARLAVIALNARRAEERRTPVRPPPRQRDGAGLQRRG